MLKGLANRNKTQERRKYNERKVIHDHTDRDLWLVGLMAITLAMGTLAYIYILL